jgi:hypothetical protein
VMRRKSCKVFIRRGDDTVEFMWANVLDDGSVLIGLLADAQEEVDFVIDAVHGEVRKPRLVTEQKVGRPKISFHPTGKYKLEGRMGLDSNALDRATVDGPPLADISAPRRMLEVLLPRSFPPSRLAPTPGDIVLTTVEGNLAPLRCTIFCMAKDVAARTLNSGLPIVDTSAWECTGALENDTHVWSWTLRASRNDQFFVDKVSMMLIGPVKWGGPPREVSNREDPLQVSGDIVNTRPSGTKPR